jgi:hypothetical protein
MQDWGCLHIPVEPYEALGGSVLLLLELVENEVLEGFREGRSSKLAVTDFLGLSQYVCKSLCHTFDSMPAIATDLDVAVHVILDRLESC